MTLLIDKWLLYPINQKLSQSCCIVNYSMTKCITELGIYLAYVSVDQQSSLD
jgi:hypothetical protein